MRNAFAFDPERCTACEACRVACGNENGAGQDTGWRQIFTFNPERHPALPTRHLSLACNHCQTPTCLLGCPAAAYTRDDASGAILLASDRCLGCRYCSWLCPYDAPRYDPRTGVMQKCSFCETRWKAGEQPACTTACPTGALRSAPREGIEGEPQFIGLPLGKLGPALVVRAPRALTPPRGQIGPIDSEPLIPPPPPRKIRLAQEQGLLAFTLILPALVAWFWAGLLRRAHQPSLTNFLLFGALAFAFSTLHLGRPDRAWRASFNLRSSWLSREIACALLFLALGAIHLASDPSDADRLTGILATVAGWGTLVAIDAVYRAVPRARWNGNRPRLHSAEAWLTGLLLFGLAAELPYLWAAAAALKASLFVASVAIRPSVGALGVLPWGVAALRIVFLVGGAALAAIGLAWPWGVLLALFGEAIDRARFYRELEPISPATEMWRLAQLE